MNENLKAFLQKASEDDALKAKLAEINVSVIVDAKEKFIRLAEENGFTLTEEDMEPEVVEKEKLSEDELNTVEGGAYTKKVGKKLGTDCSCIVGGLGTGDDYQKKCVCELGGCGELTGLGKQKANADEIVWMGAKSDKVAMWCVFTGDVTF